MRYQTHKNLCGDDRTFESGIDALKRFVIVDIGLTMGECINAFNGVTFGALEIVTSGDQVITLKKECCPKICRTGIIEPDDDITNS